VHIIGEAFYIVLFLSMVGGAFSLLALAANRAFRFSLPLWFGVCTMAAYLVPVLAPGLHLITPEEQLWLPGYRIACVIWACGAGLLLVYDIIRAVLARRALRGYRVCGDERIKAVCAALAGRKRTPRVYFGTLDEPACAAGVLHPVIILNEGIIKQLDDTALAAVIGHELTHIRRGHIILGRVFDVVCILHWFSPLAWIAKRDFEVQCEVDCDRGALALLGGALTSAEYAGAMLRLLELAARRADGRGPGPGALGFLLAKRRIERIMSRPARAWRLMTGAVMAVMLAGLVLLSVTLSRGYFYPYPAHATGIEYSAEQ